jgi:hypothetical protein
VRAAADDRGAECGRGLYFILVNFAENEGLLFFETLKLKCKFESYNNKIEVETLQLNYIAMPPFSSQHFPTKLLTTVAIVTLASHSETMRKAAIFPFGQSHKEKNLKDSDLLLSPRHPSPHQ